MKKATVENIYAIIFLLSLTLNIFSVWRYLSSDKGEWFLATLSWTIMLLALWGHMLVRKYLKIKNTAKKKK